MFIKASLAESVYRGTENYEFDLLNCGKLLDFIAAQKKNLTREPKMRKSNVAGKSNSRLNPIFSDQAEFVDN
jgi:hypothetical protein